MKDTSSDNTIRIAHIIGRVCKGGVEAVVFNYYRYIDKTKIQFDFIIDEDSPCEIPDDILALGCRVYKIPPYKKLFAYIKALRRVLEENEYRIVQSHINTLSVFALYAAKKAGVQVRIAHNHSTAGRGRGEFLRNILKYALRLFSRVYPTHYTACSQYAGEWLFGRRLFNAQGTVFYNAIDTAKFSYNAEVRDKKQTELGLAGKFVIGHAGRFVPQKNHSFLLDIFAEVYKKEQNSVLLLIGEGELRGEIDKKAASLGLGKSVMFLGNREDVHELYQAMDVFLLPSLYEGLPVVLVEAQFAGLPCIVSDTVSFESKFTDNVDFISIRKPQNEWSKIIFKRRNAERVNICEKEQAQRFNISVAANQYEAYIATVFL